MCILKTRRARPSLQVTISTPPPPTHLLQQVVVDVTPGGVAVEVEVDVHVLAETAGVVVAVRLGVAEGLQHAVGLEQHALHADPSSRWWRNSHEREEMT